MDHVLGVWIGDDRFEMVACRVDPPGAIARRGSSVPDGAVVDGVVGDPDRVGALLRAAATELRVEGPVVVAMESAATAWYRLEPADAAALDEQAADVARRQGATVWCVAGAETESPSVGVGVASEVETSVGAVASAGLATAGVDVAAAARYRLRRLATAGAIAAEVADDAGVHAALGAALGPIVDRADRVDLIGGARSTSRASTGPTSDDAPGAWTVDYDGPAARAEPIATHSRWHPAIIIAAIAALCVVVGLLILALS